MSFYYLIKEGFTGFRRAKLAAIGSIITITISLFLLGIFYIISTKASLIVESIRQKIELEAFLQEPILQSRLNEIEQQILSIDGVERVRFVSKDEAAKIFQQEFGEDIQSVLDFNPLPPSFKIFLKAEYRTPDKAAQIHRQVMEINGIENIAYRKELLEFLDERAKILYSVGLGIGIILGISAIFLVSNTIRLTIHSKRKSVQTMKLVGASRWFIRVPFLIEGMLQGFIGGIIAAVFIYYLLTFAVGLISYEITEFFFVNNIFYLVIVCSGVFLGLFGSIISVKRFITETVY